MISQEESRSISENVTWGHRKRFADGKVSMTYSHFLGYQKGADGLPEIVPEEAEVVRLIYRSFMEGKSAGCIAKLLTSQGIPTPGGKQNWQTTTIKSILTNEKYKGAALLQKRFTVDFLTKKQKRNEGEVPQYYVENSHPAIIPPEEWALVQAEMKYRRENGTYFFRDSCYSGKLVCGSCGYLFSPKIWHSTSKYRREIWRCNAKYERKTYCKTPHLYEKDIHATFLSAFSKLMANRDSLLEDCRMMYEVLGDCSKLDVQLRAMEEEALVVAGLIENCVNENATQALDQQAYLERYEGFVARYEALQGQRERLERQREERVSKGALISVFMFEVAELDALPMQFDEKLWTAVVERVTIHEDERLVFTFRNGAEVTELL